VDVLLSDHRDAASAHAFFEQASKSTEVAPRRVTTDMARAVRRRYGLSCQQRNTAPATT